RGVELLRLDHRRHKGAKRRKTEYHDSEFRRLLRDGRARYSERCERERGDGAQLRPQGHCHFCSSSKSLFCHVGLWPFVLSLILNSRAASPPLMESVCVLDNPASTTIFIGSVSPIGNGMSDPIIRRSVPIISTTNFSTRVSCRMVSV